MSPDEFVKVFDILDLGYRNWTFPARGLIFVVVGAAWLMFPRVVRALGIPYLHEPSRWRKVLPYLFLGFSLFWTVAAFLATFAIHLQHQALARDNTCGMVEGPVENFVPMSASSGGRESFSVGGVRFSYSAFGDDDGFNHTAAQGGPIDPSRYVRICYARANNTILRLEIRGFTGRPRDYSRPFLDAEEARRASELFPVQEMPWHASLFMLAYLLDFVGIYALFLPYLQTFFRLRTVPVQAQALPPALMPQQRVRLGDSVAYWDRGGMTIWLRPRGFILFQLSQMVATLHIDPRHGTIVSAGFRFSSGYVMAMALFCWTIYLTFSSFFNFEGDFPVPVAFLAFAVAVILAISFFGVRTYISRMERMVRDALGELARM